MHTINNYTFWLDGFLQSNLDIALKEAIPNDWDFLAVILGGEGSGKSTLSSQMALYLDHTLNLEKTVFSAEEFDLAVERAEPETTILWDEAITGANSKNHADSVNISLISKLTQIRFKRLKIILCIPYLFLLEKYFISRCICGIYVYAKDFNDRGHAFFYNQPQMEALYYFQKVKYPYNPSESYKKAIKSFYFNFDKKFCLPELEYKRKKELARNGVDKNSLIKGVDVIRWIINKNPTARNIDIVNILKVSDSLVAQTKKKLLG
jgi:hypothetical protein